MGEEAVTAPITASSINRLDFYPNSNPKQNPNLDTNSNPDLFRDLAAQLLNGGKGSDSTNIRILNKIVPKIVSSRVITNLKTTD